MVSDMDMETAEYSVRRDILSRERTYRLSGGIVSVIDDGETVLSFPLESVTEVRLRFYSSQHRPDYYTATVFYRGGSIGLISSSYSRLGEFENRGEQYAAFIRTLHDELIPFAQTIRFCGGISMQLYLLYAGIIFASIVFLGWLLFFLPAEYVSDLVWVKISILAMLLWMSVRFMRRNRPLRYLPADIPSSLLP